MKFTTAIIFVLFSSLVFAQTQPSGSGTELDPYLVSTFDELEWVTTRITSADRSSYYKQTANIDASSDFHSFQFASSYAFTGHYDGQNYSISGLKIERPNNTVSGLFGYVDGAVIQNVVLTNINYNCTDYSGGIAGHIATTSTTTISNCHVDGTITRTNMSWQGTSIGGLFGKSDGVGANISDCSFSGTITAWAYPIGGIVGLSNNDVFDNCSFSGTIFSDDGSQLGGIGGVLNGSTVTNCVSSGSISGINGVSNVGGIAGDINASTVKYCYSSTNVVGYIYVGGLIGNTYANSTIQECFSVGKVAANEDGRTVGGLVGYNNDGTIENCYSLSSVNGYQIIGGLVGRTDDYVRKSYSMGYVTATSTAGGLIAQSTVAYEDDLFWDTQTSEQSTSTLATGKTTDEMHETATFTNWEFGNSGTAGVDYFWRQNPFVNGDYPYLWWQTFPCTVTMTDGTSFTPTLTSGQNDQPIGRFSITSDISGAIFQAVWIRLDGTRSGASNFKLWKSDDANFDSSTDTQIGATFAADPGDGEKIWFVGLNESVSTSDDYYFLTCDLSPDATGSIQPIINLRKHVMLVNSEFQQTAITLSSSTPPLPVELTSFSANLVDDKVVLNWTTATEVNNYGFEILRFAQNDSHSESDSSYEESIGFVQGNGTTNSPKSYSFTDPLHLNPNLNRIDYRLKQIDNDGTFTYSKTVTVDLSNITDVDEEDLPTEYSLSQNYPNPFNPSTTIRYSIPVVGAQSQAEVLVLLKIYDILGNEVATLVNETKIPGYYDVTFNASGFSSGIYFYTLTADNFTATKKLMLVK